MLLMIHFGPGNGGIARLTVGAPRYRWAMALEGALAGVAAGVVFGAVDRVVISVTNSRYDDYDIFARMTGFPGLGTPGAWLWGFLVHLSLAASLGALFSLVMPRKIAPFVGPLYGVALALMIAGFAEQRFGFAQHLFSYDLATIGRVFGVRILWGFILGTFLYLGVFRRGIRTGGDR